MSYNFAQYAKGINLYFIIDMVILITVFAILLSFFIYKRNMKVFFLLLLGGILEVLVNVLSEIMGGEILAISKYVMHLVVIFDIVASCVVYQNDLKNIFQKVSTAKGFETHNSDDELRDATAEILTACQDMAKQDVGAIIIIDSAGDIHDNILDTGTRLNATLSAPLLRVYSTQKHPFTTARSSCAATRSLQPAAFDAHSTQRQQRDGHSSPRGYRHHRRYGRFVHCRE